MRRLLRYVMIACAALAIGTMLGVAAGDRADQPAPGQPVARGVIQTPAVAVAQSAVPRAVAPQPAWMRNAVITVVPPGRVPIAIVIDDMGVDRARSDRAAALPAPLTLAFLPYARAFEAQIAAARDRGHEILLHMPMQPIGAEDPGPGALTVALNSDEIRKRVAVALDRAGPVVGVNNHMGSRFTVERDAMRPVLEELHARGLLFLDSRTAGATVGPALARTLGVPYATRDVFLDNDPSIEAVQARLAELEATARRQGHGVAIGHPHDGTIAALSAWLPSAAARGFALVPVSTIVRQSLERPQRDSNSNEWRPR
jgi:polysaccharide deacetylase 2 family uncharacterized protein YibQ